MKMWITLFASIMILSACSSASQKSGPSQADYERQQKASDKAMDELTREANKVK